MGVSMTDKETFFDESYNIAQVEKPKFSDDYEILGDTTGGMGEVYFCREKRTGTLYALKQAKDDEKIRSLFEHEAAFALELDRHPNIVYTYTVGKEDGNYYIVMELIDSLRKEADVPHGRTLQDEFVRGAEIPLQTGYKWAVECCEGMEYLNAKGMAAHKDIKPANIFITKQGVAKIGDFGLVGLSKKMSGTPGYRAPEIKDGVFNVQSDIYAFGVVLYQLFNKGSNPLDKTFYTSAGTQMQFEGEDVFPRPETIRSRAAQAVIRKCLAQNPSERYASFKALQADLVRELKTLDPSYSYQPAKLLPMSARDFVKKGQGWYKLKDSKKELRCYNRAKELDPKYVPSYNIRGLGYFALNGYDKALSDFTKAIELNPKDDFAYRNRSAIYVALKEYDKALADCTKAIELDPKSVFLYISRGVVYGSLKEYDKALADYAKVIELDPNNAERYSKRGWFFFFILEDYEKALEDFTKAIELDGNTAYRYAERADVYKTLKQYDKAAADYAKAIELNPRCSQYYDDLINLYEEMGELQKVEEIKALKASRGL